LQEIARSCRQSTANSNLSVLPCWRWVSIYLFFNLFNLFLISSACPFTTSRDLKLQKFVRSMQTSPTPLSLSSIYLSIYLSIIHLPTYHLSNDGLHVLDTCIIGIRYMKHYCMHCMGLRVVRDTDLCVLHASLSLNISPSLSLPLSVTLSRSLSPCE
jgi:hypothetical protein